MDAKDKAEQLVNEYRILLMNEDTECGNEILCTTIAKQCSLIAVDLRFEADFNFYSIEYGEDSLEFWELVKTEINKI